ncbi:hypothetical protein SEUCBS140593_001536 [Sporothrix eucalyptigena]|uniref:Urea amidolyase n=1 Tax=Sporothrix eucalyptigena TaxID=1812306 RepID=A0ABP0AZ35_9PEZI
MEVLPQHPITIDDWRAIQTPESGLDNLLKLAEHERQKASAAWISLATPQQIRDQWDALLAGDKSDDNHASRPLWGIPFAIKDNIDVESFPTTAACPIFSTGSALEDATVISRLKAAGAVVLGKTNLDQFATGLVGTRSPYGAVPNAFDATFVSGGSSAGSGVVVSRGVVPFSLGTDTAGSGRVPAGLNNIVGLKPTRGALSTSGVVPACRTLDCVSIFAQTVEDAATVLKVAEGYDAKDAYSRERIQQKIPQRRTPSLAICANPPWFGRNDMKVAYEAALERARGLDWQLTPVDFSPLFELARLLYEGPWVAERYHAVRQFLEKSGAADTASSSAAVSAASLDPTVHTILLQANKFSATDAFAYEYKRQELTRIIEQAFAKFDGLLVPTAPSFPTHAEVAADPIGKNAQLGTYTNFVNFLDWSALAMPAGFFTPDNGTTAPDDLLPFGMTLVARIWQEDWLLDLASDWLAGEARSLGATGLVRTEKKRPQQPSTTDDTVSIVVVGAHLSGLPLNGDLVSRGAALVGATYTAPKYKLYALATNAGGVPKPGLKRVSEDGGASIAVEEWRLPTLLFASFIATIPHPLGIGSVELEDGSWKKGFICEPTGLEDGAVDITHLGGWRSYIAQLSKSKPRPIKRVLIANRGEIAARIVRTLHSMGLEAVAIHSNADADTPHVKTSDVALPLGGGSVAETYLDGDRIIQLALTSGADAVIPGYGFLAENADFAGAVEDAGLVWIGPTPTQMRQLGLKHAARDIAVAAGIPVVPGGGHLLETIDEALEAADAAGYPVMLKSTAGGGGIGLRRCANAAALRDAFDGVQQLAQANFGDRRVFVERFVSDARHIEVQIIGDGQGGAWAAGERDCSLQRRHQKVVEEAPAPNLPDDIRKRMHQAAIDLASAVKYRSVGTVEFIYDAARSAFYFLEVNARLQVEHPVTEAVTGLDLVEMMVRIAGGDTTALVARAPSGSSLTVTGAAIETRLYAESPRQDFRPSTGTVVDAHFPAGPNIRVDTWVHKNTVISSLYDPMVAKIISFGPDRGSAVRNLASALTDTHVAGLETNRDYLAGIVKISSFRDGDYTTNTLESQGHALLASLPPAIEVLAPGASTTVQDLPGRLDLWHAGIPPSGPMDSVSFRLANHAVGNPADAAALEVTAQGPTLLFHSDAVVAVTGATVPLHLRPSKDGNGEHLAMHMPLTVCAGQVLEVGSVPSTNTSGGYRVYIALRGGIDVPQVFGSRSTFDIGHFGGHNGRKLLTHDLLRVGSPATGLSDPVPVPSVPMPLPDSDGSPLWDVAVVPGPHGAPDIFTADGLADLFSGTWTVHYNSNRLGVRLTGPRPQWARTDGGEGGLHPSNILDAPYSMGGISFTGDDAIVLTCDGPSLGGFAVFCVVATVDLWKIGQARPGDRIRLHPVMATEAAAALKRVDSAIKAPTLSGGDITYDPSVSNLTAPNPLLVTPIISTFGGSADKPLVTARQAGDRYLLLEFGADNVFDIVSSLAIVALIRYHADTRVDCIDELTPGVRTLHVNYRPGYEPSAVLSALEAAYDAALSSIASSSPSGRRVSSRRVRMPIAMNDSQSRRAIARYAATIRGNAPWVPNNASFVEQLNGLPAGGVAEVMTAAEFLVIGLGDVYLGSPCGIPLDPRHRLLGTKYNPSRSYTPRSAVGLGGQFLCIYGGESPGGYQLVGRTRPVWDDNLVEYGDVKSDGNVPWVLRVFDRISFYPVAEADLDTAPIHIDEDAEFDVDEYIAWLGTIHDDATAIAAQRRAALENYPQLNELLSPAKSANTNTRLRGSSGAGNPSQSPAHAHVVEASMPGRCFKLAVTPGDTVRVGDTLLWIESNKMELQINSPAAGKVTDILVDVGHLISPSDPLLVLNTTPQ